MIEVYIDGSSRGNPGPGGAGVVIKQGGETISLRGIPLGQVTNNQAEFLALKHALAELKHLRVTTLPIKILTDSTLVVGVFSQNWKARANLELVAEIKAMLKDFRELSFAHVRGHNGDPGNELADSLAQEAAEGLTTKPSTDDPADIIYDLVDVVESAIEAGHWRPDAAYDPYSAIYRAERYLRAAGRPSRWDAAKKEAKAQGEIDRS